MKRFLSRLFRLALIAGIIYAAYQSVIIVPEGRFGAVFRNREDLPFRYLTKGISVVPQAVIRDSVSIVYFGTSGSTTVRLKGVLPGLDGVDVVSSHVRLDAALTWEIDPAKAKIRRSELKPDYFSNMLSAQGESALYYELNSLFKNGYDVKKFDGEWSSYGGLQERIKSLFAGKGISVKSMVFSGLIYPAPETYARALAFAAELDKARQAGIIQLTDLKKRLELKEIEERAYYGELDQISKRIRENPEILKYIYIQKASEKHILPLEPSDPLSADPGKLEVPAVEPVKNYKRKEIDNLR